MFMSMTEELARQRRADLLEQACRQRMRLLAARKTSRRTRSISNEPEDCGRIR